MKKNLHSAWQPSLGYVAFIGLMGLSILAGYLVAQQNSPRNVDRTTKSFLGEITPDHKAAPKAQKLLGLTGDTLANPSNDAFQIQPDSIVAHLPKPDLPQALGKTNPTQIFYANSQCDRLTTAIEQIPSSGSQQETATRTLRSLLARQKIYGVKVNDYRVILENGVATVDITLDPSSRRQMSSLSSCEQFALFRAIETTLMQNQFLTVTEVKFTEAGRNLYL
jgi:hypothetical protein